MTSKSLGVVLRDLKDETKNLDPYHGDEALQIFLPVPEEEVTTATPSDSPTAEARGTTYYATPPNQVLNHEFRDDLTSWTENITATGSTVRNIVEVKRSRLTVASLKLAMTNSAGASEVVERHQTVAVTGGETLAWEVWRKVEALANCDARLLLEELDSGGAVLTTTTVTVSVTSGWAQVTSGKAMHASAVNLRIRLRLISSAASGSGVAYWGAVRVERNGSATITSWDTRLVAGFGKAT